MKYGAISHEHIQRKRGSQHRDSAQAPPLHNLLLPSPPGACYHLNLAPLLVTKWLQQLQQSHQSTMVGAQKGTLFLFVSNNIFPKLLQPSSGVSLAKILSHAHAIPITDRGEKLPRMT